MPPLSVITGRRHGFSCIYTFPYYLLFSLMNKKLIPIVWALAVVCLGGFTACGDDEPLPPDPTPVVPDPEPEPEPEPVPADTVRARTLRIVPDWSDALAEEHLPGSFRLAIGDTTLTASDIHTPILYSDSVQTVPYRLVAYNEPKGIIISSDSIATIQTVEDTLLTALPDYLFAADTTATVEAGDTATVDLWMHRLLMPITLTLNFSEPAEVADVRGTLSGLISSIHLPDGTPVETEAGTRSEADATSSKALMAYEILPDNDGIRLLVRTFGIDREERQQLDVIITLADGRVLTLHVDMTEALRDFGHLAPIALENSINTAKPDPEPEPEPEPTPDPEPEPEDPPYRPPHRPKVPIDVSATISNWETIEEDNIDIY